MTDFDPYEALLQLGKNQEDLYSKVIINTHELRELQQHLIVQNQRVIDLHKLLAQLLNRLDQHIEQIRQE